MIAVQAAKNNYRVDMDLTLAKLAKNAKNSKNQMRALV